MKELNDTTFELESYEEYLEKAKVIRGRDPGFVIYPDTGRTFVWARNNKVMLWCLLEKNVYEKLVESGDWEKGIYRLWSKDRPKTSLTQKKVEKYDKTIVALEFLLSTGKDLETMQTGIKTILKSMRNL